MKTLACVTHDDRWMPLNYFFIYPPLIFLKNGQPLSVPPRNRKTPNGDSIGGFLFTFTRERVSRRNHNARRKTHPIFLVGSQHHFSQGISKCQSKTYQGEPRTVSF